MTAVKPSQAKELLTYAYYFSSSARREYDEGKPEMLWERGLIPEYEGISREQRQISPYSYVSLLT